MNATKVKSLAPLYGGVALLVIAVAGAALSLLSGNEGREKDPLDTGSVKPMPPVVPPVVPPVWATAKPPAATPKVSAEELEARDKEELGRIIIAQIEQTPDKIDEAWLERVCQYVAGPSTLEELVLRALEQGEKYDAQYRAEQAANNMVVPADPRFFINQARKMMYGAEPSAKKLQRLVPGLLAMGLFREYQRAEGDWGAARDVIRISYMKESLQLARTLGKLAVGREKDTRALTADVVRLHEAAIVDHFLRIERYSRYAREDMKETDVNGKPVRVRISQWNRTLAAHLLELGKIHVEAAWAETLYKRKQQQHAEQAFEILAMVYKLTKSGEAMLQMRESNQILRYNIWKMGQAAWTRARQAAASGDSTQAQRQYLLAKHRYLQCLSRLEMGKRETVFEEYRKLQQDIYRWTKGKTGQQVDERAEES